MAEKKTEATAAQASGYNAHKKITTKEVGLTVAICEEVAASDKGHKPVPVMRLYGDVYVVEEAKTTQFGSYVPFKGNFEAVNVVDGTIHRAQTLLLPQVAEMVVCDMVTSGQKQTPGSPVRIALDITAQFHDAKNGTKFKFGCVSLIKGPIVDAISEFGASLPTLKALTAK